MGEYTEIQGQIARIEAVYRALNNLNERATNAFVSVGSALIDQDQQRRGFFASVGGASAGEIEYRPTIAGALTALEMRFATQIDTQVSGLKKLEALRATMKIPNFDGHLGASESEDL